jgi:hypothetical protein
MSFFKVSGIQKWCLSADQALRNAFDEAHSRAMERKLHWKPISKKGHPRLKWTPDLGPRIAEVKV